MEGLHSILLSGVLILLTLCAGAPAFGKEIYESPESEQKVKDTMTVLQDGLDDLEDAVLQGDIDLAVKLSHEIDEASHRICNIDLSRSALSKDEQQEFERLRKTLHFRTDKLTQAADKGNNDEILDQSYKVREACDTCHTAFKKKKK